MHRADTSEAPTPGAPAPPVGPAFVPSRVPRRGPPVRAIATLAFVALGLVVAIGRLGPHTSSTSSPRPPVAVVSPSPTALTSAAPSLDASNAHALPVCPTPPVGPLAGPIVRHPHDLVAPDVTLVANWDGPDWSLAVDRDGSLWSLGSGHLRRLDPATGETDTWRFTDDPAFAANAIKPARGGGVWLIGGDAIRWFDGIHFRDVIAFPPFVPFISDVAEAPDGSIWATAWNQGLFHWDGVAWSAACGNDTGTGFNAVAVGPDGSVWVLDANTPALRHSGADGQGLAEVTIPAEAYYSNLGMAVAPDGAVWVGTPRGPARFDGAWTTSSPVGVPLAYTTVIALAPDGVVWAVTGSTDASGTVTDGTAIVTLDGAVSRSVAVSDGLPASVDGRQAITSIAVGPSGDVFAATGEGIYRLGGTGGSTSARWTQIGPRPLAVPGPSDLTRLVVGRDGGLWGTTDSDVVWREHDGAWSQQSLPGVTAGTDTLTGLASRPDGTVAVASSVGVVLFGSGPPRILDHRPAAAIAFGPDGALWVAAEASYPETGRRVPGPLLASFRLRSGRWVRTPLAVPAKVGSVSALAFGPDRSLWLRGDRSTGSSIWHQVGGTWKRLPAGPSVHGGVWPDIAVDTYGDIWAGSDWRSPLSPAARFDGTQWSAPAVGAPVSDSFTLGLAVAADGTTWIGTDTGLATVRAGVASVRFLGQFGPIAIGPDGAVYVAGPSGIYRMRS